MPVLAVLGMLVLPVVAWVLLPFDGPPPPVRSVETRAEAPVAPTEVADEAPEPSAPKRVISGIVVSDEGAYLDEVVITVEGAPGLRATSDPSGHFQLRNAPAKDLTLVAEKGGYSTVKVRVLLSKTDTVEVLMNGRGAVRGEVRDPNGKPAPGAFVSCDIDGRSFEARTNAEGRFEMASDVDGCMAVAELNTFGSSTRVRLTAGANNILDLRTPGAIEGIVVDEQGRAVPAFLLAIESFVPESDPKAPSPGGKTNRFSQPNGAFRLDGLDAGRYVLTVSAEGRPPARSDSIVVETSRTTSNVRIVLSQGAKLSGVVVDEATRKPIAGAEVALDAATWTGANAIPTALSDANGAYTLVGVPSDGPFSVRFSSPQYTTRIVTGLAARGQSELREDVTLTVRGEDGAATEFAGIGAVLAGAEKGVQVAAVVPDGPAAKGGIVRGDRIVRIDGGTIDDLTVSDCVQRLRGPPGSSVTVTIEREGQASRDVLLVRELIRR